MGKIVNLKLASMLQRYDNNHEHEKKKFFFFFFYFVSVGIRTLSILSSKFSAVSHFNSNRLIYSRFFDALAVDDDDDEYA